MALLARGDPVGSTDPAISVLIVDDSAVARAALSRIVAGAPGLVLSAALDRAERAMDWLANHTVDVVLLDIDLPGRSGLAALPDLIAVGKGAQVMIVSSTAQNGAEATVRALALGAVDTLAKPSTGQINQSFGEVLIDRVRRIGRAKASSTNEDAIVLRPPRADPVGIVAIGASTGGLRALSELLMHLPSAFQAPILITQHLPTAFMPYFAEQVAAMAGRPTCVATEGKLVGRGEITVAPGDAHVKAGRAKGGVTLALSREATPTRCCPSVDPMFASAADAFGANAVAVVLSGMGRDGLLGAQTVVNAGGTVIVQDVSSSAVWGMPGTVARGGLANFMGTPSRLAAYLGRRVTM